MISEYQAHTFIMLSTPEQVDRGRHRARITATKESVGDFTGFF